MSLGKGESVVVEKIEAAFYGKMPHAQKLGVDWSL